MPAGDYRHRVDLQSRSTSRDAYGGQAESWSTYDTVWAAVEPQTASDEDTGEMATGAQVYRVRMRHRDDVERGHRIQYDGLSLGVRSVVNPMGRDRELQIVAQVEP